MKEEFDNRLIKFKPLIEETIHAAVKDAKVDLKDVGDVELIGSALRVPIIKDYITEILKVSWIVNATRL